MTQGYLEMKEREYEAQAKMMGGKKKSSGPTSGSVRNGASSSGSQTNKRVENKSFVNPDAGDPLEDTDDD